MLPKWNLADIRSRLFNTPLMVSRPRALDALGVMGPKLNVASLLAAGTMPMSIDQLKAHSAATLALMGEQGDLPGDGGLKKRQYDWATDRVYEVAPYEVWNGLAVLSVRGSLMAENGLDPASGATGYDGLSFKARHAAENPEVLGAILDLDSGGGQVVDLLETCTQLRNFAVVKPLRAVVRGYACSAAYALAACAGPGQITAADYSVVGSIGAIMLHADFSKQLEEDGVNVTMITSAEHKADGSPLKPLDPDVEAKLKGMVDACAATFIDHVSAAREVDRQTLVDQQAAFFSGQEALSLGLVDKFMSWDDSMREFAQFVNSPGASRGASAPSGARSAKGTSMSNPNTAPAAEQQPEFTQEHIDAAELRGEAKGQTMGATAERARFTALAELDGATTMSADLATAIEAGTSAGDFAIGLAKAAKAQGSVALAAAKADAVAAGDLPAGGAAGAAAAAGGEPANRGASYAANKKAAAKAK